MQVIQINSSPADANAYLIIAPKSLLIDVGTNAKYVLDRIEDIMDPANIELIILTHAHYDHWGAVEEVSFQTGAKIAIHTKDAGLLSDDISSVAAMFGAHGACFQPDIILNDSELIGLGNGSDLEVINTPGHTQGSICLYHSQSRSLFSGDTVFPEGSFGRTDLPSGDGRSLVGSLKRLAVLDVDILYPGHGYVTKDDVPGQIRLSLQFAGSFIHNL
jgi:glyoxylase-like metal-dependent hydrolase (beta-lactamase superfamily II)